MSRALALGLSLALGIAALAPAALAQEAIPTAGGVNPNHPPKTVTPPADLGARPEYSQDDYGPRMGPCGPATTPDGKPDKSAHGEVSVGVGTNGYRHIGGAVCKPIGENGAIAIAVDKTDGNYNYGRRYRY